MTAASLPWLVAWELRIQWRQLRLARGGWPTWTLYGGFLALLHGLAWLSIEGLSRQAAPGAALLGLLETLIATLAFFMVMSAFVAVFRLLHAGRELTPLLAAPLPFARLLWARVLGVVAAAASVAALLVLPVVDVGLWRGEPAFLLALPVALALAAISSAACFALFALVIGLLGVRRAQRALPWLQAALPVGFVLSRVGFSEPQPLSGGHDAVLWRLPAEALLGDPLAMAAWLLLGGLAIVAAVRVARGAIEAVLLAEHGEAAPRMAAASAMPAFRTGLFRVLLLKEWRTLLREPRFAVALLSQPLIVLPLFYVNLLSGRMPMVAAATALTFVAAQLSQFVAQLMISAEEAPSLLGAAPLPRARLIALKCLAALLPILLLLAGGCAWLALLDGWAALAALACGAGAAFCSCAIEVARPYPAPRRSFVQVAQTRRRRDPLDLLSVLAMQIGWASAAWCLASGYRWGGALVLLLIGVPFVQWWREANRQDLLGY